MCNICQCGQIFTAFAGSQSKPVVTGPTYDPMLLKNAQFSVSALYLMHVHGTLCAKKPGARKSLSLLLAQSPGFSCLFPGLKAPE